MKVWLANGVIALLALIGMIAFFPGATNTLLYKGLWLHVFDLVSVAVGAGLVMLALSIWEERPAMAVVYGVLGLIGFALMGPIVISGTSDWKICQSYKAQSRNSLVPVDLEAVRFTPLEVAHNDMVNGFNSSQFTVELEHVHAVNMGQGVGYVVPITPDGFWMHWTQENDGFMIFDDRPEIESANRVRRIKEKFKVGEEMQWLDNLRRNLYSKDRWCDYSDVYYLPADPTNPDSIVIVACKVKYRYEFPCFWVPYWAGATIVNPDGAMREVTVDELLNDTRFAGQLLHPISLALTIVKVQKFDQGVLSGFVRRPGKIEIPELPGRNQMPYFIRGNDGHVYHVVATRAEGGSHALFRVYYVDAHTGVLTYYEYNEQAGIVGPERGIEYVKSLRGYNWVEHEYKEGASGNFRVVESIYLAMPNGELWWKYTITTQRFNGVVATAVVNGHTKEVVEFRTRDEFDLWLRGDHSASTSSSGDVLSEILALEGELRSALTRIETLKNSLSSTTQ